MIWVLRKNVLHITVMHYTFLRVSSIIAELLGLPADDRDQFFKWTNEVIGSWDPDFAS